MNKGPTSIQLKIVMEMVRHSVRCNIKPEKLVAEGKIKRLSGSWYELLDPSAAELLLSVASGTEIGDRTNVRLSKASLKRGRAAIEDIRSDLLRAAKWAFEDSGETECAAECRTVLKQKVDID